MAVMKPGVIALFDVDGTFTTPRKDVTSQMLGFMRELKKVVTVGIVGGSNLSKITKQLGKTVMGDYDYVFSENGLVAHKDVKLIGTQVMLFMKNKTMTKARFTLMKLTSLMKSISMRKVLSCSLSLYVYCVC